MDSIACEKCDYAVETRDAQNVGAVTVSCRRNPPQLVGAVVDTIRGPALTLQSAWPSVAPDAYCGEFYNAEAEEGALPAEIEPAE